MKQKRSQKTVRTVAPSNNTTLTLDFRLSTHQYGTLATMAGKLLLVLALVWIPQGASSLTVPHGRSWAQDIRVGYRRRVEADPSFPLKSVVEVFLAAGTQFTAEWERRGPRLLPEIDFVCAGVLTAVAGKYFSMWKVAPTQGDSTSEAPDDPTLFQIKVPTNAFQRTMLDGITRPKLNQRLLSFVAPVVPLFRAGFAFGFVGYTTTAGIVFLRSIMFPSYVAVTRNVNVLYASLYTGAYMALSSNVRYQMLQGVVEPLVDTMLRKLPVLRGIAIFLVRLANGLLGSILAIQGMRLLGLQRLK